MTRLFVAPTEPPELKLLGDVNGLPELKGSDIMWSVGNTLYGVQRKSAQDLVGSIYNGKLNHEMEKMHGLGVPILLIEGKWSWSRDGEWTGGWTGQQRWTRPQMVSYLMSVQAKGIWVIQTDDLADTIRTIEAMFFWSGKAKHSSLNNAPKIPKADRRQWVLQAMCPGLGPEMTQRLIEANGGELPLRLTMTEEEIRAVPGWGPKRARQLVKAFNS